MKRLPCLLLGCLFVICAVAQAQPAEVKCDHYYQLFAKDVDGEKCYSCMCVLGCNTIFNVYPMGYEVAPAESEDDTCAHVFRTDEQCKRVSVESASQYSHQAAKWYDCVCECCGEAIEAFVTDGKYYDHQVSEWDGVHIEGETKHLMVGYCDICNQLRYEIVNCYRDENGRCSDGGKYMISE